MHLQIFTDLLKIKSVMISSGAYIVNIHSDPRGVMLWCVRLRWISIEGGWNALRNNGPRLPRAKNEGQPSLITTLKHYQHLFKPKTTLSLGINLLNH